MNFLSFYRSSVRAGLIEINTRGLDACLDFRRLRCVPRYPEEVSQEKKNAAQRVGLCLNCRYMRRMESDRGAIFYLCRRSATDERFPKYPRLPVLDCAGYEAVTANLEDSRRQSGSR